jgi:hypothetical protein
MAFTKFGDHLKNHIFVLAYNEITKSNYYEKISAIRNVLVA